MEIHRICERLYYYLYYVYLTSCRRPWREIRLSRNNEISYTYPRGMAGTTTIRVCNSNYKLNQTQIALTSHASAVRYTTGPKIFISRINRIFLSLLVTRSPSTTKYLLSSCTYRWSPFLGYLGRYYFRLNIYLLCTYGPTDIVDSSYYHAITYIILRIQTYYII